MLTPKDYQDAITVQDGVNLSGIVYDFARILPKIWEESNAAGRGTAFVNTHPICILFADKIKDMTKRGHDTYFTAMDKCKNEAAKEHTR